MALSIYHDGVPGQSSSLSSSTIRAQLDALYQGDRAPLKARATNPPSLSLYVNPSIVEGFYAPVWVDYEPLNFAGGTSVAASPSSSYPLYGLLLYDVNGSTLSWAYGTTPLGITTYSLYPICLVYLPAGATMIVNPEDRLRYPNAGYIYRDLRTPGIRASRQARGYYATSEGDGCVATGYGAHAEGFYTTASGYYSHAEGYYTTASGYYSHAEGDYTTASGYSSHAEGFVTTASGYCSHAEGSLTTAYGDYSHAEGFSTTASGYCSHAEGRDTAALGYYSHAEGYRAEPYLQVQHAHGNGDNFNFTRHQYSRLIMRRRTTDATQSELFLDGTNARAVLPANTAWGFRIYLVARSTTNLAVFWEIKGLIKRDGNNNTAIVGSVSTTRIAYDSSASSWAVTVNADDTNESLRILVTGASGVTIDWCAVVELTEVTIL